MKTTKLYLPAAPETLIGAAEITEKKRNRNFLEF